MLRRAAILNFICVVLFEVASFAGEEINKPISAPSQNQMKGERPSFVDSEDMARRLLVAIEKDDSNSVHDLFFPEDPFLALKDIRDAKAYYRTLIDSFAADIHKQSIKFKSNGVLTFQKFKPGFCKWKDVGSEYNKIPYWSCYRSEIKVLQEGQPKVIPVKVMINWGAKWYITHLGR